MRPAVLVLLLGGCRIAFDPSSDGHGAAGSCSGYAVCDDFEIPTFGDQWKLSTGVTLDQTQAHRGTQSVHIHMDAFPAASTHYRQLTNSTVLATSHPEELWVRAWLYLAAVPAPGNRMELMSIESPQGSGGVANYLFVHPDKVGIYTSSGSATSEPPAAPVGSWFCVVFDVSRSTTGSGYVKLTSDVLPSMSLTSVTTDAASQLADIYLGIGYAAANVTADQPATDIWIDDVILDSSPVGCTDY